MSSIAFKLIPTLSRPSLINAVLSFIRAYRLKGDNESIKERVCECFSPDDVNAIWDYCRQDFEAAGLPYHSRCGSDRHSQLATEIPSLSLDPIQRRLSLIPSHLFLRLTNLRKIYHLYWRLMLIVKPPMQLLPPLWFQYLLLIPL